MVRGRRYKAHYRLGQALVAVGEHEDAIEAFDDALARIDADDDAARKSVATSRAAAAAPPTDDVCDFCPVSAGSASDVAFVQWVRETLPPARHEGICSRTGEAMLSNYPGSDCQLALHVELKQGASPTKAQQLYWLYFVGCCADVGKEDAWAIHNHFRSRPHQSRHAARASQVHVYSTPDAPRRRNGRDARTGIPTGAAGPAGA